MQHDFRHHRIASVLLALGAAACSGAELDADTGNAGACASAFPSEECDTTGAEPENTSAAVYALAQTGVSAPCGTLHRPCYSLQAAADQLSAERPNLVLLPTPAAFQEGVALPEIEAPIHVFGNGVRISTLGASAFRVARGEVTFDAVFVENARNAGSAAITCAGGRILVRDSTLRSSTYGIQAEGCDVTVLRTSVDANDVGIHTLSGQHGLSVLESWLEGNAQALYSDADPLVIQNNVFLRNGHDSYMRVIELRSSTGAPFFGYNTLVGNFNNCIYVGIVACEGASATLTSNISWNNFPDWDGTGDDCLSQVFSCRNATLSNTIAERTWPGENNSTADPLFVDAANDDYHLQPGSPAIDRGNQRLAPARDYYGSARAELAPPDVGAIESAE